MAKIQNGHPSEETFEQYSLGRLAGPDCEPFENHLLICSECQDHLAVIDAQIADIKHACRVAASSADARRRSGVFAWLFAAPKPMWAAAAAALVLTVSVPLYREATAPRGETEVTITTSRGAESVVASAPARTRLKLNIEVQGVAIAGPCRVDLVNSEGRRVWTGQGLASNSSVSASVAERLPAGQYWVRIFNPSGELVRESALQLNQ
jgi:hypothetical protein